MGNHAADPEPKPSGTPSRGKIVLVRLMGAAAVIALGLTLGPLLMGAMGAGGGSYAFIETANDEPVTWDHCRAIRYQVNPKGAPANWKEIVDTAIAEVSAASGFVFADRGTTVKRKLIGAFYEGNEPEPVLIMWSDQLQDHQLTGNTIGIGGSGPIKMGDRLRYVIGRVVLDTNLRSTFSGLTDDDVQRLVLEHELGHVLGLDHVNDRDQLMSSGYVGQTRLGSGDVAGLRALHAVPCG